MKVFAKKATVYANFFFVARIACNCLEDKNINNQNVHWETCQINEYIY